MANPRILPSSYNKLYYSLLLVPALLLTPQAQAQNDSMSLQDGIEELVVTANKREQNSQDVASAITAIGASEIALGGITDATRLEAFVPGLRIGVSGGEIRPALRGARTNEVGVAGTGIAEQVVGIFQDGIYIPTTTSGLGAYLDVNRIEILRGPQGTLYGRNTFAGSINVVSNKPDPDAGTHGNVKASVGSFSRVNLEGVLNLPLGSNMALRAVFAQETHDPVIENLNNVVADNGLRDKDESYFRLAFSYNPDGPFSLDARIDSLSRDSRGDAIWGYQQIAGYQPTPVFTSGAVTSYEPDVTPQAGHTYQVATATVGQQDPGPYEVYRNGQSLNTQDSTSTTVNVTYEFGSFDLGVTFNNTTTEGDQYYDSDYSDGGTDVVGGFGRRDDQTSTSFEVQLVSNNELSSLEWVAGLYSSSFEAKWAWLSSSAGAIVVPSWGNAGLTDPHTTDTFALYGQGTYAFSDSSRLTFGLRQNSDDKQLTADSSELTPTAWDDSNLLYKLAYEQDLASNSLVYVSSSTGVRTGGVNDSRAVVRGAPAMYDSEEVSSLEAGWKNVWMDGRFVFNLAFFTNTYSDVKAQLFAFGCNDTALTVSGCITGGSTLTTWEYYENGGDSTTTGTEIDLRWLAADNLLVTATAAFVDAEFDSGFSVGNLNLRPYLGLGNIEGRQDINSATDGSFSYGGYSPALSPAYQIGVGVAYTAELGGNTLTPSARINLVDDYYAFDVNLPETLQSAHSTIDFRLTYAASNYDVELFVLNLTDEQVLTRAVVHSQQTSVTVGTDSATVPLNSVQVNWNNPTTFGVSGRYRF